MLNPEGPGASRLCSADIEHGSKVEVGQKLVGTMKAPDTAASSLLAAYIGGTPIGRVHLKIRTEYELVLKAASCDVRSEASPRYARTILMTYHRLFISSWPLAPRCNISPRTSVHLLVLSRRTGATGLHCYDAGDCTFAVRQDLGCPCSVSVHLH